MDMVEGICIRAGSLKRRLTMMRSLVQDKNLLEIKNLWKLELGVENEDTYLEEVLVARYPIMKT